MKPYQDIENYQGHYSEPKFWKKVESTAKKVGLKAIYAALVLYYALGDPKISAKDKTIIWGALGYFILPLDLLPDFIPVAGYTDDVAALLLAVYKVAKCITPQTKLRAEKKLHDWFGDYDRGEIIIDNFNDNQNIDEQ